MKKTILVILAVMVALTSVFATVHAGADFDLSVRVDSSKLFEGSSFAEPQLRFIAKPYYSNEKFDLGLRFKFGYDYANFLNGYAEAGFPVYSFLTTVSAYNSELSRLPEVKYPLIAAEFIDHITYNGNWLTLSLNREKEMEVSTLATGKYVKESILNTLLPDEFPGLTSGDVLLDPNLSLTLSAKHGDFSFFSFIDNVGGLGGLFYNAAGVEVQFASALKDGLKYKASVLAQGSPISIISESIVPFSIIPDLAVSYETTNGDTPVTYTAEANLVLNNLVPTGFAAQFGSSKKYGKLTLDSDIYVTKNITSSTDAFRNTSLNLKSVSEEGLGLYAIGADLNATVNFNNNGKMYLGTGFGIKAGLGETTTFITDNLTEDNGLDPGAAKLDYLKAGLTFGDTAWFGVDAEMDYFYTWLFSKLMSESTGLTVDEEVNLFSIGITTGRKFNNGLWELNLKTGAEDPLDVVGTFKMTYKLGN